MAFKAGDKVTWQSQSAGYRTIKSGFVTAVVPPRMAVRGFGKIFNPGAPRDHESYVVRVPGRGLYWPVVSLLRLVEEPAQEQVHR